jgi:chromate transporter
MEEESNFKKGVFLFWSFMKGMCFAFTGGMTSLPIVEKDVVERKHWISKEEFWSFPVISQSLPGVISVHNAMMIGNAIAGPAGSIGAVLGVIFPAFFSMLIAAMLFQNLSGNPYVQGLIRGIRIVAIAIISGVAVFLVKSKRGVFSVVILIAAIAASLFFNVGALTVIIIAGALGIAAEFIDPQAPQEKPVSEDEE